MTTPTPESLAAQREISDAIVKVLSAGKETPVPIAAIIDRHYAALRAEVERLKGLCEFLNQPLPVTSRAELSRICLEVSYQCEKIPAHEEQTKTAIMLSDLGDAIRKSGGRDETLADLTAARALAEKYRLERDSNAALAMEWAGKHGKLLAEVLNLKDAASTWMTWGGLKNEIDRIYKEATKGEG